MIKRRANTFFMIVQAESPKAAEVFVTTVRLWSQEEHKPKNNAIDIAAAWARAFTKKNIQRCRTWRFRYEDVELGENTF